MIYFATVVFIHMPAMKHPGYETAFVSHTRDAAKAHSLLGSLAKMSRDIHGTFHELFPPIPEPIKAIKAFEDKKAPIAKYATGRAEPS